MYSPLYVIYQICINPHTQLLLLATSGEKQKFMSYIKIIDKQDSRWLDTLIAIVPTDFLTDEEFASYLKNRNNNRNEK